MVGDIYIPGAIIISPASPQPGLHKVHLENVMCEVLGWLTRLETFSRGVRKRRSAIINRIRGWQLCRFTGDNTARL